MNSTAQPICDFGMSRTCAATRLKSTSLRIFVRTKAEMPTIVTLSANPSQFQELRVRALPASLNGADKNPPCDHAKRPKIFWERRHHGLRHVVTAHVRVKYISGINSA